MYKAKRDLNLMKIYQGLTLYDIFNSNNNLLPYGMINNNNILIINKLI